MAAGVGREAAQGVREAAVNLSLQVRVEVVSKVRDRRWAFCEAGT